MALPTAATPGYGYLYTYTSHPNVGCNCLREWIPVVFREAYRRGILPSPTPRVIQATGMADASALVHSRGMMFDFPFPDATRWHDAARRDYRILGPKTKAFLYFIKEMGGWGWPRFDEDGRWDGDPWENNEHLHGGVNGCPHGHSQAYDQLAAYKKRLSGLASGGTDPYPRPSVYRTWKQGIAWAEAQINGPTTTTPEEDDVNLSDRVTLTDNDREAMGTTLESMSVAALLKYGAHAKYAAQRAQDQLNELERRVAVLAQETADLLLAQRVQVGLDKETVAEAIGRTRAGVKNLQASP